MSLGVTQTIGSAMPVVSAACFIAAGAFVGRKVICGLVCKAGSKVADLMGKPNAAEWNQASADYFAQAKADAPRDFAAATGFVLAGLFAKYAGDTLKEISPKPEPTKYEKYIAPVVGFVVDYKKPIIGGVAVLAIFAGIKRLYNNQTPLQPSVLPIKETNFKSENEIVKGRRKFEISQEAFNKAFDAPHTNIIQTLSDSTMKKPPTLITKLTNTIATKYGIGLPNYELPLPAFEEMQAAHT